MPRVLPFTSTAPTPPPETMETLSMLVNDIQVLALDRSLLLALARYAHQLAATRRATLAAEAAANGGDRA